VHLVGVTIEIYFLYTFNNFGQHNSLLLSNVIKFFLNNYFVKHNEISAMKIILAYQIYMISQFKDTKGTCSVVMHIVISNVFRRT
jgi:hypothetical protein